MGFLPEEFEERMERMLGDEYAGFLESYEETRQYGLRVNRLKCGAEEFEARGAFELERIPWVDNGFYYPEGVRPAQHPYYAAGVYYLQEPSAMTPASRLEVVPGDRVLDLCAAPGGKATELAAKLAGQGVLVANDISAARAKILLYNLELSGVTNAFVTNEIPGNLAGAFEGWFDKVLVDAPCSGEGMFRKNPEVAKTWTPERPLYFAKLQQDIVENAVKMLKPGGWMLYSTCTFSPEENEGTISWLLEQCPEMELMEMELYEGFRPGVPAWGDGNPDLCKCVHIWPQCMDGEGHFLALLRKRETAGSEYAATEAAAREAVTRGAASGTGEYAISEDLYKQDARAAKKNQKKRVSGDLPIKAPDRDQRKIIEEFTTQMGIALDLERIDVRGGKAYLAPELPGGVKSLHFLRSGLYLGEFKKNRFEPSQAWAMSLSPKTCQKAIMLSVEDERVGRYLRGETISGGEEVQDMENGWKLICVENFSLGWGKLLNGVIKNKYLSGWRKN